MTHIAENWLIDWKPVTVMGETPPRDPDDDEGDNDEDEEDDEEDEPAVIREPDEDE
jgi:hypothetical protein